MKVSWKAVVGVAVSAFFIWWVLRGEDPGEIVAQISRANPWYFIASVFVGTAGYFVRALRWKILLHPLKADTRLRSRFAGVSIGFAVNNTFPARLGEFARAFALSRAEPIPVSGAFGSLVVERFLDSIVIVSMFLVPLALPSFPGAEGLLSGAIGVVLKTTFVMLAIFLAGLVAILIFPEPSVRAVEKLCRRLPGTAGPRIVSALEAFLQALMVLRDPALLTKALLWSYAFWLWHTFSFWLGFRAFGIDLGFDAAVFTMAVVGFAVAIPAAPGFFGTFQLGTDLALSGVYGVSEPTALAFSFGYHLGGFFPITIIGFYYAWRLGFSVSDLRRSEVMSDESVGGNAGARVAGVTHAGDRAEDEGIKRAEGGDSG